MRWQSWPREVCLEWLLSSPRAVTEALREGLWIRRVRERGRAASERGSGRWGLRTGLGRVIGRSKG